MSLKALYEHWGDCRKDETKTEAEIYEQFGETEHCGVG